MPRISAGISQIGGKYRLVKELLRRTPHHEFFLSCFCGACWFEINKPRCRYEAFNDRNSELINYLLVVSGYDKGYQEFTTKPKKFEYNPELSKMFDEMKQGILGLVSQETCNRIIRGDITPKDDLERAYFFYYLNKLTFGGGIWMVRKNPPFKGIDPSDQAGKYETSGGGHGIVSRTGGFMNRDTDIEKAKEQYQYKTKGNMGLINPRVMKTLHDKDIEEVKANFRGLKGMGVDTEISRDLKKKSSYKGINPKVTRPFTNNDLGLLSPLDPECIKRLRYVNLTAYDFRKVYDLFYNGFHVRKGLGPECFLYFDPPYPGTENYYKSGFGDQEHLDLIEILLESPFHCMVSIGGDCEIYLDILGESGWIIDSVNTKYSTDANSQNTIQEFIIMNYDINQLPLMTESIQQTTLETFMKNPEVEVD